MIDLTAISLSTKTAVELRKLGAQAGIKGASKGRREELLNVLSEIQTVQQGQKLAEQAKAEAAAKPQARKSTCNVCGKRRPARDTNGMCTPCHEEGAWENAHSDEGHTDENKGAGCWICFPELNKAQAEIRTGASKAGMEVVAKGNKAETFKAAAEAKEYRVSIETNDAGRTVATATHADGTWIQLAWNGRAYDYLNSSAKFGGKERKVRNLKEALRLLEI